MSAKIPQLMLAEFLVPVMTKVRTSLACFLLFANKVGVFANDLSVTLDLCLSTYLLNAANELAAFNMHHHYLHKNKIPLTVNFGHFPENLSTRMDLLKMNSSKVCTYSAVTGLLFIYYSILIIKNDIILLIIYI